MWSYSLRRRAMCCFSGGAGDEAAGRQATAQSPCSVLLINAKLDLRIPSAGVGNAGKFATNDSSVKIVFVTYFPDNS